MQAIDRYAIEEFGIPGVVLMENAGSGTVRLIERTYGSLQGSFAIILVGPGNNGGDGLVIGRHLHQRGCEPVFFFFVQPDKLGGDSAVNLAIVQRMRLPFHVIDTSPRVKTIPVLFKQIESRGKPCCGIIDALFGTGLDRHLEGHYAEAINLVNSKSFAENIPVIAVDTPTGLDSTSGKILGTAIKASLTATFGCPKPGQVMQGSSTYTGDLHVIDIGIPPEVIAKANVATFMLTSETTADWLTRIKRKSDTHKGTYGHLLILAGSAGKTGAAILAAKGALRSGCGLVSLGVPYDLNLIFETSLPEAMTVPLQTSTSLLNVSDIATIVKNIKGKGAIVLGPGIGTDSRTAELVLYLYHTVKQPMILDADALNIIAQNKSQLKAAGGPRIFTPHPGEMARLIDRTAQEVQGDRLNAARTCHKQYKIDGNELIIALKGAGTLIVTDNQKVMVNTSGNPGMATGGMGDVLGGIIGSLICQGLPCDVATGGGVYLHGMAGDALYQEHGSGYTASELAREIPACMKQLQNSPRNEGPTTPW
jgi:NAD(P)H-hydrate epimerase